MTKHFHSALYCFVILFATSLALQAQDKTTLVLTNGSQQAIWVDKVIDGKTSLPAGYLPPKGRIYLALDRVDIRKLEIHWHHMHDKTLQQQALVPQRQAQYLTFAYDGKEFQQIQNK